SIYTKDLTVSIIFTILVIKNNIIQFKNLKYMDFLIKAIIYA
ncbi:hypothetical protein HMPREF3209_02383, partial [Lactobacillus crispatus]